MAWAWEVALNVLSLLVLARAKDCDAIQLIQQIQQRTGFGTMISNDIYDSGLAQLIILHHPACLANICNWECRDDYISSVNSRCGWQLLHAQFNLCIVPTLRPFFLGAGGENSCNTGHIISRLRGGKRHAKPLNSLGLELSDGRLDFLAANDAPYSAEEANLRLSLVFG